MDSLRISGEKMVKNVTEEQIKFAMDLIAKKGLDVQVFMYDMQNLSTVDHKNAVTSTNGCPA